MTFLAQRIYFIMYSVKISRSQYDSLLPWSEEAVEHFGNTIRKKSSNLQSLTYEFKTFSDLEKFIRLIDPMEKFCYTIEFI